MTYDGIFFWGGEHGFVMNDSFVFYPNTHVLKLQRSNLKIMVFLYHYVYYKLIFLPVWSDNGDGPFYGAAPSHGLQSEHGGQARSRKVSSYWSNLNLG